MAERSKSCKLKVQVERMEKRKSSLAYAQLSEKHCDGKVQTGESKNNDIMRMIAEFTMYTKELMILILLQRGTYLE